MGGDPSYDVGRRRAVRGSVQKVEEVDVNGSTQYQSLNTSLGEGSHCSFTSTTASTLSGGCVAKVTILKGNGGVLHHTTGVRVIPGVIRAKARVSPCNPREAMRFLPRTVVECQAEKNSLGNS